MGEMKSVLREPELQVDWVKQLEEKERREFEQKLKELEVKRAQEGVQLRG